MLCDGDEGGERDGDSGVVRWICTLLLGMLLFGLQVDVYIYIPGQWLIREDLMVGRWGEDGSQRGEYNSPFILVAIKIL